MTCMNRNAGVLILVAAVLVMVWLGLQYWQVAPSVLLTGGAVAIFMLLGLVVLVTSLVLLVRAIVAIFYRPWREGAGVSAGLGVAGLGLAGWWALLWLWGQHGAGPCGWAGARCTPSCAKGLTGRAGPRLQ